MTRWFKSTPLYETSKPKIDKKKGIIYKVAVCTEGEAKGHGVFLDSDFIDKVATLGNGWKKGLKARFGHPNMSNTALGTFIGSFKNFRTEIRNKVNIAFADLYLDRVSKKSPSGDLYEYVLDLADTNPKEFGTSIVFDPGREYRKDKDGKNVYSDDSDFNKMSGEIFEEIEKLTACDVVDSPAANPDGLFSDSTFAGIVTRFFDENPQIIDLVERHPEVLKPFMTKYKENTIVNKNLNTQKNEGGNMKTFTEEQYESALGVIPESASSEIKTLTVSLEKANTELKSLKDAEVARLEAEKDAKIAAFDSKVASKLVYVTSELGHKEDSAQLLSFKGAFEGKAESFINMDYEVLIEGFSFENKKLDISGQNKSLSTQDKDKVTEISNESCSAMAKNF